MSETADNYLRDLGPLVLEYARAAKRRAQSKDDDFEKGQHIAFYAVLSLMKQQAIAFGLSEKAIGLDGVDLERELLV